MEALRQPGQQAGLRRGQIHAGHTDARKSQLAAPALDGRHQRRTFFLSDAGHPSTVASAPPAGRAERILSWHGEDDTTALAAALAAQPALDDAFIALHGDLGAGKTTFVRHLLRALGVAGRIKSPTYAVVEPHMTARGNAWHFDFYRFEDPREWEDAGFRDIFQAPGLKLAEWPEKAANVLPVPDLDLHLSLQDDGSRRVQLVAGTPRGAALLEALA